ncbi:YHS domain-containing (seleno)protein [Undibacterium sp. Ji67W]|uniref:YHS domain-containing (seleno)protein n=1 Tax=Undibacterium sp. Ji67W TaxID=3413042 RepID=UPI003BF488DA
MFIGLVSSGLAKEPPIYTPTFSNVAVSGYDAVAYFTQQKPVKGDPKFSTEYMGAKWQFSTAENRDKFVKNPEQFAPQYGGYCAWAVAQGWTASGDPTLWKIVNDKLYLNYDKDKQQKWEADIPGNIKKANANWPKVLN